MQAPLNLPEVKRLAACGKGNMLLVGVTFIHMFTGDRSKNAWVKRRIVQGATYSLDDFSLPWRLVRHYAQMQLSTYKMATGNPAMRAAIARHNVARMMDFLNHVEMAGSRRAQFGHGSVQVVQVRIHTKHTRCARKAHPWCYLLPVSEQTIPFTLITCDPLMWLILFESGLRIHGWPVSVPTISNVVSMQPT